MAAFGARSVRVGIATGLAVVMLLAACGGDGDGEVDSVEAAQAKVSSAERDVASAEKALESESAAFCKESADYIDAVDRYGAVFDQDQATVGDVKTAGADLTRPREAVESSVDDLRDAQDDLAKANAALVEAQNDLLVAQSSTTVEATTTTTTPAVAPSQVDRVKQAEEDLTGAGDQISDETPLVEATASLNSAAYALEIAWLRVFADAGCFTDEQEAQAVQSVSDYTTALQTALTTAGYYAEPVDGVYGPSTVEAVQKLQTDANLPTTGYVDQATALALSAAVTKADSGAATEAVAETAAVQATLKLAGYWTGAVDGKWTPELTEALKEMQTALGVEPTGTVDAATLDAVEKAIADAQSATTSTTSSSTSTTQATDAGSTSSTTDY